MEFEFNGFEGNKTIAPFSELNGIVDLSYAKLAEKLVKDYNAANEKKDWQKRVAMLEDFKDNCMMPKEFWKNLYGNKNAFHTSNHHGIIRLSMAPYCYFQDSRTWKFVEKVFTKTRFLDSKEIGTVVEFQKMNSKTSLAKNVEVLITNLKFPHWQLRTIWKWYEKNICSHPLESMIEIYQKMKKLHEKLESLKNVEDEIWFNAILEAEETDPEFVEQMTEYRLGEDLSEQNLWKLYIEFLKRRENHKRLLYTYSRYCRFFLDDVEMKEEYQKAAEKYGRIEVSWKNPFEFEIYKNKAELPLISDDNLTTTKTKSATKCLSHFSEDNAALQSFPFKETFIYYIFQHSNLKLRKKLFETCKYFYPRYPTPIFYKFIIDSRCDNEIFEESMQFKDPPLAYDLEKICISTVFKVIFETNRNLLSTLIPRIHQCDAKYIDIFYQNLSYTELKFLIENERVSELRMGDVLIVNDDDGKEIAVEDILKLTPRIELISLMPIAMTANTPQNLLKLQFKKKFKSIRLCYVTKEMDGKIFAEFLNKNVLPYADINLFCEIQDDSSQLPKEFSQIIREELIKHWKTFSGPHFNCRAIP